MKVEVFGHLRQALRASSLELKIEGRKRLKEVLEMLPEELKAHVLDEYGAIRPGIMILINDIDVRTVYNYEVLVSDSDRLTLVPMIHGGSDP